MPLIPFSFLSFIHTNSASSVLHKAQQQIAILCQAFLGQVKYLLHSPQALHIYTYLFIYYIFKS